MVSRDEPDARTPAVDPRDHSGRSEIEAQIAADPYDDAPYAILSDQLQLDGDPRGELIAIDGGALRANGSERAAWRARRTDLLARHPALAPSEISGVTLGWHLGFVRRVTVQAPYDTEELLEHPSLRFATELILPDEHGEDRVAEIAKRMPLLRYLALGDPDAAYIPPPGNVFELDAIVELARLERLFCLGQTRIKSAPRLRSLELASGEAETLRWLRDAELPTLERLSIQMRTPRISLPHRPITGDRSGVATIDDFAGLLATPFPNLTELGLTDVTCGDALIRALVGSPLVRQLRVLRLWNAGITLDGAQHATPEAFGHLALLDLTDPGLDDATAARLERANPTTRTRSTRIDAATRRPPG